MFDIRFRTTSRECMCNSIGDGMLKSVIKHVEHAPPSPFIPLYIPILNIPPSQLGLAATPIIPIENIKEMPEICDMQQTN